MVIDMKQFSCIIEDPMGIHARAAGIMVNALADFADTEFELTAKGQTISLTSHKALMKLMGLNIRKGDTLTLTCQGAGEEAACAYVKQFLIDNFAAKETEPRRPGLFEKLFGSKS